MADPRPWRDGDHLVICDSCGVERYRSQCDFTWDGYLMCHVLNCWYPKHAIFEIPPVINDPAPLYDVRPDESSDNITMVSDNAQVGLMSTFQGPQFGRGTYGGRVTFDSYHEILGSVDSAPDYPNET